MTARIISCFGVLVLTKFLEAQVTVDNQIKGLKGTEKGKVGACTDGKTKDLLFVLDDTYGMSCDDGSPSELVLDICIVSSNENDCTYVLGDHLNALMKLKSLETLPGTDDSDKEMWKACEFVKKQWNDIKDKANKIETPITTVRWNVLLGQYHNGVYKVIATETGNAGDLAKLTYVPLNSKTKGEMDAPNDDAHDFSTTNCTVDKYLIYGAVLYNCTTKAKPELIGCIKGPLEKYEKEESDPIQLSYYTVDSMRQLRAVYSYVVFKSPTIPMAENIKGLNVPQICSALAVDADLNGLPDQNSYFVPTFYDEEITAPWSFPKFKGIEPPTTI